MIVNLIHSLQRLIFKRVDYFRFLTYNEVDSLINSLKKEIDSYKADIAIGIKNGGLYPGESISKLLNVKFSTIYVSHYCLPFELDDIVGLYRILKLFGYKPKLTLKENLNINIKGKKVLLIDDDSYSGLTIKFAKQLLLSLGPKEIKVAVLHTYNGNPEVDYAGKYYDKDIYYKLRLRFPWSKISPYYKGGHHES